MTTTQNALLTELEPVVETNLNRHLASAKPWNPHDYVPWSRGRDFEFLGGEDWVPEDSPLDDVAKAAMLVNLLTEDNLPSYHREIAENFSQDGAWGTWVGRWTAEENRHSVVMRDYLVVTRGVDPVELEEVRMAHMTSGFNPLPDDDGQRDHSYDMLFAVAYVSFQELATRVSHRNTGKACGDPIAWFEVDTSQHNGMQLRHLAGELRSMWQSASGDQRARIEGRVAELGASS